MDTAGVVIGSVEDPPEEVFGSVSGVAVSAGRIYVADQQALPRLRLFQIGEAFVAGVSRDELGVDRVEVLPLRR